MVNRNDRYVMKQKSRGRRGGGEGGGDKFNAEVVLRSKVRGRVFGSRLSTTQTQPKEKQVSTLSS